jgi:putative DNA primase/helicase
MDFLPEPSLNGEDSQTPFDGSDSTPSGVPPPPPTKTPSVSADSLIDVVLSGMEADTLVATADDGDDTDMGNAAKLLERHGQNFLFAHEWLQLMAYKAGRWVLDRGGKLVQELAKDTVRWMRRQAIEAADQLRDAVQGGYNKAQVFQQNAANRHGELLVKSADRAMSHNQLRNMVDIASSDPRVLTSFHTLDTHPSLFNVVNKTIDLQTGEAREHRREDLLTQISPVVYDPTATCPVWDKVLARIMDGNQDMIDFVYQIMGYTLSGSVEEQVFFYCQGDGANGKSTLVNVLMAIMGEYAMPAPKNYLKARATNSHQTEMAMLHGKRMLVCVENNNDGRMDEGLIKLLTSEEHITGRRMREDFWSFPPTHKIWVTANYRPDIRGIDEGIWRRLLVIPFNVFIPAEERTRTLLVDLKTKHRELPGILNRVLAGWSDYLKNGLKTPQIVLDATNQYRDQANPLKKCEFYTKWCDVGPGLSVGMMAFHKAYERIAHHTDLPLLSYDDFKKLVGGQFPAVKDSHTKIWKFQGIDLKSELKKSFLNPPIDG